MPPNIYIWFIIEYFSIFVAQSCHGLIVSVSFESIRIIHEAMECLYSRSNFPTDMHHTENRTIDILISNEWHSIEINELF